MVPANNLQTLKVGILAMGWLSFLPMHFFPWCKFPGLLLLLPCVVWRTHLPHNQHLALKHWQPLLTLVGRKARCGPEPRRNFSRVASKQRRLEGDQAWTWSTLNKRRFGLSCVLAASYPTGHWELTRMPPSRSNSFVCSGDSCLLICCLKFPGIKP